jgi:hypothetical protein
LTYTRRPERTLVLQFGSEKVHKTEANIVMDMNENVKEIKFEFQGSDDILHQMSGKMTMETAFQRTRRKGEDEFVHINSYRVRT